MRRLALLLLLGTALSAGCGRKGLGPQRPAANPAFQPPHVELPKITEPRPLPATRVLHIFYTSNVVGDLEPCG